MRFAPAPTRLQQLYRAERLHDEIDPDQTYPMEQLTLRITGYRPETEDDRLLVGEAVASDLRLLIDSVSRSITVPVDDENEGSFETPQQLAARLNVSVRTLARWRELGLRWRWVKWPDEPQPRLVYPREAVACFLERYGERVDRASRFTQLPQSVRADILRRARRIAQARQVTLNQVARHLAHRLGRAVETVRQILQQHDTAHPEDPIFTDRDHPLDQREQRIIARAHRMGVPMARLVQRFNRTRATIYRIAAIHRAAALRQRRIEWVDSPLFHREDADDLLLPSEASEADEDAEPRSMPASPPAGWPEALQPLFTQAPLNPRWQRTLALRMNYLLYKAAKLRDELDRHSPSQRRMDQIEHLLQRAGAIRRRLVLANLPTLAQVVQQHARAIPGAVDEPPSQGIVLELVDEGFSIVLDGVIGYDVARSPTLPQRIAWLLRRTFAARHGAAGTARRAHRRVSAEQVLSRLKRKASEAGVVLDEPAPPAAGD